MSLFALIILNSSLVVIGQNPILSSKRQLPSAANLGRATAHHRNITLVMWLLCVDFVVVEVVLLLSGRQLDLPAINSLSRCTSNLRESKYTRPFLLL
jgi:hypothetical protein